MGGEPKIQHQPKINRCWVFTGIVLIIIGSGVIIFWPCVFNFILLSQRILYPDSPHLHNWLKTPAQLTFNIYFWNWTNPEDIHDLSIKPRFEQIGPFSYKHTKEKVDVVWNNNDTVSYKLVKTYFFDEENSKGNLNDTVTSVDSIARSVAYLARKWSFLAKKGVSMALSNLSPQIHVTRTVDEFLFKGFDSFFIDLARKTAFATGIEPPAMDKFGYFYGKNGSAEVEGYFNMATGTGSHLAGELLKFRYENHTGYYPDKCGEVRGFVAGELFPTNLKPDAVSVFSAEQGRNFKIEFQKEVEVDGIKGYKYSGGPGIMDNGSSIPENACYCVGECLPSGSINASTMIAGVPIFMTFPHFYEADPFYLNMVEGMEPDQSKHELYVSVEPMTGIPLEGAIRIQLNMLIDPDEYITLYNNIPRTFIPILWLEEKAVIPKPLAETLKLILKISTSVYVSGVLLFIIGIFCIALGMFHPINRLVRKVLFKSNTRLDMLREHEEVPLKNPAE